MCWQAEERRAGQRGEAVRAGLETSGQ
jgi:hypothetical protein